jgi:ribokinase
MMKAIGIGELVLDKTLLLNNYPIEGGKVVPEKSENSIGGPVASALILLSKLGVETYLVASVANDEAGEILKKKLEREGVKLLSHNVKKTKVHTVIVNGENGSRTIIKDNVQMPQIELISKELIQSADVILFDRHEHEIFDYVVQNKRPDTRVVIDTSDEVSAKTLNMLKNTDLPIVPIEAINKIRRHENTKANIKYLYDIVQKPYVITAGGYGSILVESDNIELYPAYDLEVVDTLGAGDIYRGAFAYGLMQNWEIKKILDYANLVAGLQCTKLGNSTAIPSSLEIQENSSKLKKKVINLNFILNHYAN